MTCGVGAIVAGTEKQKMVKAVWPLSTPMIRVHKVIFAVEKNCALVYEYRVLLYDSL